MSRKQRVLQKRFAIFCEGDTEIMLDKVRGKEKLVRNVYDIKKTTFDITIKSTDVDFDILSPKCSNIEEFFDVIDW